MKQSEAMNDHQPTEQELTDMLYALIEWLYKDGGARELRESFAGSLAAHDSLEERLGILEHWVDYYRLKKYQRLRRRRRPTFRERITSCSACGYPTSHRHHLWDIAMHGENQVTIQLCANCHELHHLMYNALARESTYSRKLLTHTLFSYRIEPAIIEKILGWCRATLRYEAENGWIETYKASDEWVEAMLHWSDYRRGLDDDEQGNGDNTRSAKTVGRA